MRSLSEEGILSFRELSIRRRSSPDKCLFSKNGTNTSHGITYGSSCICEFDVDAILTRKVSGERVLSQSLA